MEDGLLPVSEIECCGIIYYDGGIVMVKKAVTGSLDARECTKMSSNAWRAQQDVIWQFQLLREWWKGF
jgi:hypothetical protein